MPISDNGGVDPACFDYRVTRSYTWGLDLSCRSSDLLHGKKMR